MYSIHNGSGTAYTRVHIRACVCVQMLGTIIIIIYTIGSSVAVKREGDEGFES